MATRLPATMQVFERGWLSSNNILFTGSDTALVDSGYATHASQTVSLVHHALGRRPLDRLLNTHLHSDHCGGNAALQAAYGCRTAIPASEADKVARWDEDALSFRATGQQCPRFIYDTLLAPGDLRWQVLGAPGHDPHALLLFCPQEGILIAGDALWRNGFGVVFPELAGEPGFDEVRATLDLIATLDARLVVPGHGGLFEDVDAALARAYSRLDYLAGDPRRNAENAIKVLLKFLLLERGRVALAELPGLLASIPVVDSAMRVMAGDAIVAARPSVERVGGKAAYPTSHAHTRSVGGSPPYASNECSHATAPNNVNDHASTSAACTTLANWAVAALVCAGAARIDGANLMNA